MTSMRKKDKLFEYMLALFFVGGHGSGFGFGFGWFDFKTGVVGVVVAAVIGGMVAIVGVALSARIRNYQHLSAFLHISTSDPHPLCIYPQHVRNLGS